MPIASYASRLSPTIVAYSAPAGHLNDEERRAHIHERDGADTPRLQRPESTITSGLGVVGPAVGVAQAGERDLLADTPGGFRRRAASRSFPAESPLPPGAIRCPQCVPPCRRPMSLAPGRWSNVPASVACCSPPWYAHTIVCLC